MENRYKLPSNLQKRYLLEAEKISGFSADKLAKLFGIVGKSYRDWRRGKYTITQKAVEIIEKKFQIKLPYSKDKALRAWQKEKKAASRKGGIALFKKHGSPATHEGRHKGGIKSIANLRKNGIIPSVRVYKLPNAYSKNLAEFVGIMLGDGGITSGQCAITLNSEADIEYFTFVSELGRKLFGESPKFILRKNCKAIVLYYNGVSLVKYFIQIGLKIGNKVKQQVDVPDWIKNSYIYRISCLRGLMDTDGGVFQHNYKVNGKMYNYQKICFSNRSIPILNFIANVLKELKLTPKIIDKVENKKVWLYNQEEVSRYLRIIGTHNPRLLKNVRGKDAGEVKREGLLNL